MMRIYLGPPCIGLQVFDHSEGIPEPSDDLIDRTPPVGKPGFAFPTYFDSDIYKALNFGTKMDSSWENFLLKIYPNYFTEIEFFDEINEIHFLSERSFRQIQRNDEFGEFDFSYFYGEEDKYFRFILSWPREDGVDRMRRIGTSNDVNESTTNWFIKYFQMNLISKFIKQGSTIGLGYTPINSPTLNSSEHHPEPLSRTNESTLTTVTRLNCLDLLYKDIQKEKKSSSRKLFSNLNFKFNSYKGRIKILEILRELVLAGITQEDVEVFNCKRFDHHYMRMCVLKDRI